ncbi:MAG: hypothetical protein C0501_30530 [Isosphaera sp.]|nr:hypothetical protein [Isosphaera sp.]
MFGFIRRLLRRPPARVFVYSDGARVRAADPVVIAEKLLAVGPGLLDRAGAAGPDPLDAAIELGLIVDQLRKVFDVGPFEDRDGVRTGLTKAEVVALLRSFAAYLKLYRRKT